MLLALPLVKRLGKHVCFESVSHHIPPSILPLLVNTTKPAPSESRFAVEMTAKAKRLCYFEATCAQPVAMAALDTDSGANAEQLQQLWANSYEGWISPPGVPGQVVYLEPFNPTAEIAAESSPRPWVEDVLQLADVHGGVFGLTAYNPMGVDKPHSENVASNARLEAEIRELCSVDGRRWWHSFGFASDWHEKGFSVAAPEDDVLTLAKKYGQGAVYRFSRPARSEGVAGVAPFVRSTVPALLPETDADVLMVPSSRPPVDRADPLWVPESS